MFMRTLVAGLASFVFVLSASAQDGDDSDGHMKEELGVNEYTTPSIAWLLVELDKFRPVSMDYVDVKDRDTTYPNRLQTALHFGSLIGDGFIIVQNERRGDIQEIGRAILRQAKALGVGDSLARRSNSIYQLGDKGDWQGVRKELAGAQRDVEKSMMQLRDEQMAHLIALGGWMKGFWAAAGSTAANYSVARADALRNLDTMDYFIDRLDTLHPKLKATDLVTAITSRLKTARQIVALAVEQDRALAKSDVTELARLAREMNETARMKVDDSGRIDR